MRLLAVAALALVLAFLLSVSAEALAAKSPSRSTDYSTPGFKGLKKAPHTGPAPAPPSLSLGAGTHPDALVDQAGTAHIVWNEESPPGGSDVPHYCRLPRSAKACDNPSGTPFPPVTAAYSNDVTGGPKILQLGDGLVMLQYRYPAVVTHPDGQDRSSTLYAWVSTDGGTSWTGPSVAGVTEPSGDAAVIGDRVAVISDTVTGGTQVQLLSSGLFNPNPILLGPGDAAYGGTIADDGGVPIVAFRDLNNVLTVRRYGGAGDVNDPSTWSATTLQGVEPKLASGPAGTYLMYRAGGLSGPWTLRPVQAGVPGPPLPVSPDDDVTDEAELLEDAAGGLRALWTTSAVPQRVLGRTSLPGGGLGAVGMVAQADGVGALRASTAKDAGGVAVLERAQGTTRDIAVSAFGTLAPTGLPGAGSRAGSGIPGAEAGCQLVKFGAVQVRPRGGLCFLPSVDPKFRGAVVSEGEIDLNGLAIIPTTNAKIVIDPRRGEISSIGDVRVVLRGGGLPELTLLRGKIDIDFKGNASVGESIFKGLAPNGLDLGGFPIAGSIDVKLTNGGLRIPLTLKLPDVLGGVSGEAVLVANPLTGVTVESARVQAGLVPLGPLTLEDIDVRYSDGAWDGGAALRLPPPKTGAKVGLEVHFKNGRFLEAKVTLDLPGFGVLIAPQTYFYRASGRFLADPITMSVTGSIGVFPVAPTGPTFTVTADGTVTLKVAKEVELGLEGTGKVLGLGLGHMTGLVTTGGYAEMQGDFGIDLGVVSVNSAGKVAVDGPSGRFAGRFSGNVKIATITIADGAGAFSNDGVAACVSELGGYARAILPAAGGYSIATGIGDCEHRLDAYTRDVVRSAQATSAPFTVPANASGISVEVTGVGGVPSVVLVDPKGTQVAPQPFGTAGATAISLHVAEASQNVIGLKAPAAGGWTVQAAPGSVPIAGVRTAVELPTVAIKGVVRGSGRARMLRYTATGLTSGTQIRVYESGRGTALPVGVITKAAGTLRLRAGQGRAGTRTVTGYVATAGQPPSQEPIDIVRYSAPGVAAAPRVAGVSAGLRGGQATVRWRRAPTAAGYVVTVRLRDGRVLARSAPRSATSLTIRGLGSAARLRGATVRSRSVAGVLGPAARARVRR